MHTWHMVEEANRAAMQRGDEAPELGVEVRCALAHAGRQPEDPKEADDVRWWAYWYFSEPPQARPNFRPVPEQEHRACALAELAPHLPEPRRTEALRAALRMVPDIEWNDIREEVLSHLEPHLAGDGTGAAIATASPGSGLASGPGGSGKRWPSCGPPRTTRSERGR